jgi:RimJ/RimL family protein N-acetyltransferase
MSQVVVGPHLVRSRPPEHHPGVGIDGRRGESVAEPLASDGVVTLGFFRADDAAVLAEVDRDREHRLRFGFPLGFVPSLEHSRSVISRWERERAAGERFTLAVRNCATGELVGGCELRPLYDEVANLSYWTHPAHRGRGFASRAVALACDVAFRELGYARLEVLTDPDNVRSRGVAVRNGFREIGIKDGRILHVRESIP